MSPIISLLIIITTLSIAFYIDRRNRQKKGADLRVSSPNDLEHSLIKAKSSQKEKEEFLLILKDSWVYILGNIIDEKEEVVQYDKEMEIMAGSATKADIKGWTEGTKHYIPVFTSIQRLQQLGLQGEPYVGMKAKALFALIDPSVTIIINHRMDCEMRLNYEEIKVLFQD